MCQFTPLHVRRNKITIFLQNPLYIGRMSKPQRSERNHGMRVLFFFNSLILPARREYKSVAAHRIIACLCMYMETKRNEERKRAFHAFYAILPVAFFLLLWPRVTTRTLVCKKVKKKHGQELLLEGKDE